MNDTDARTPFILGTALVLAMIGDYALRGGPLGLGFSLWAAAGIGGYLVLRLRLGQPVAVDALPFATVGLACSALVAVRASPALTALNVGGTLSAVILLAVRTRAVALRVSPIRDYLLGLAEVLLDAGTSAFGPLARTAGRLTAGRPDARPRTLALARGAALTLPAFAFFGFLLVAADASFERAFLNVMSIDAWTPVNHLVVILAITLAFAGVLLGRLAHGEKEAAGQPASRASSFGLVETAMLVGTLDLLFAAFVFLQIPHFFGGAWTLASTPDLTAAEYARRGFFELLLVEAVAVPLLLGAELMMRGCPHRQVTVFRVIAGVNLALLAAIAASAALRLVLYGSAFGLTESRVYAGAALVWLVSVLVALATTVLSGRRERFAYATILAAFAVLLGLNTANPDALIATTNLARATAASRAESGTSSFDAGYNARLSEDATPALVRGLGSLGRPDAARLLAALQQERTSESAHGWRAWNLSRHRAEGLALPTSR